MISVRAKTRCAATNAHLKGEKLNSRWQKAQAIAKVLGRWTGCLGFVLASWGVQAQVPGVGSGRVSGLSTLATSTVTTDQVRAELLAHAPQGVLPGQTFWLGLQLNHQPQWHTYWKNSGDSGLPTQLEWTLPAGWTAGDIAWPTPKRIPIGPLANYGYEGTVLLPVPVAVNPAFRPSPFDREIKVGLKATWLVCKLECIPQEGQFEIKLPLQGSVASSTLPFEATFAATPKPFKTGADSHLNLDGRALRWTVAGLPSQWQGKTLEVFPETPEITSPSAAITQSWDKGVWLGHVEMSRHRGSDPAQLPVVLALADSSEALQVNLPVTGAWPPRDAPVASPVAAAPAAPAPASAWGLALMLALLGALVGGLLLNLMPCVFPILAIKALQLTLPGQTSATQRATGLAYTGGVVLSTLALGGLLLVLRAAGQGLGWGFQLQNPVLVMVLAALFVLIAMNLMGSFEVGQWAPKGLASMQPKNPVISAFMAGILAVAVASPCSAPFMGAALGLALTVPAWQALLIFGALGLGLALPFLLLGFMPQLAAWLPKPGVWMDTFKRFLAFPMLATAVWLVWVLGQQNGLDAAAALLILLLTMALVVWVIDGSLLHKEAQTAKSHHYVGAGLALVLGVFAIWFFGPITLKPAPALTAAGTTSPSPGASTAWQVWSPARQAQALAAGQSVFVDYTAAWCVTCQFNKQTTLNQPEVLAAFQAKKVLLLRADWTRPDPVIAQSIAQLGRSAVPVYVLQAPGKAPKVLPELLSPDIVQQALAQLP